MKRIVFLIILFGNFFDMTAQNKAIDTVWFRAHRVTVVDAELLDALDSMILVYTQDLHSKLVWYITFEDVDSNSESKVELYLTPSDVILPVMKKSDGFFQYKNNLFFIEKRIEQEKKYDHIFEYSNKAKLFYYIKIDWDLFWASDEESKKINSLLKYASIADFPSVLLIQDFDGLWSWRYTM